MSDQQTSFLSDKFNEEDTSDSKKVRKVRVQAQRTDKFYDVDLDTATCTCSTPKDEECFHLKRARDVHENKCKDTRYDIVSSLHKEVRRGDVRKALYWADILSRHSTYYAKFYVRQICSEETRNLTYWRMAIEPKAATYRDLTAAITSSRKNWEHKKRCRLYKANMRGYIGSFREKQVFDERSIRYWVDVLKDSIVTGDVDKAFLAFWWFQDAEDDEIDKTVWPLVDQVLLEESSKVEKFDNMPWFMENWHKCGGDRVSVNEVRTAMLETALGGWDESMNDFVHDASLVVPFDHGEVLFRFEDYVYDYHTRIGKAWVHKWQPHLRPQMSSPGRLDLRWSGQEMGVGWRHAAFYQHGIDYVNVKWEDVKFTKEFWLLLKRFDETIPLNEYV